MRFLFKVLLFVILLIISTGCRGEATTIIKLFDARPLVYTGTVVSEATVYATFSVEINFAEGDRAVLSSTSDGTGGIIVDNYIWVNSSTNICANFGDCFGQVIDPDYPEGATVENVWEMIPPLDVSSYIIVGNTENTFFLADNGGGAGNTDIYLIITHSGG